MRHTCVVASVALLTALGMTDSHAQAPAPKKPPQAQVDSPKASQPIDSTKRFAEHTGLARASTVIGMNVQDSAGKKAGDIEELMIDSRGHVAYAVVSFGGLLGIGDRLYAVPWDVLRIDRDQKTVFLDIRKETVERAPYFAKDKWPDPNDREWGPEVRKAWADAAITAAVKSKLAGEKASTLIKVDVDTNQGVVELNGNVESERLRQRAGELARQVDGVRKIVNKLKISG